jgi:hypothetical protein
MRIFLFVSLFLIAMSGVPAQTLAGANSSAISTDSLLPWQPVFGTAFEKSLYRATLDISKHHLSGYLFIKKTADSSLRIIFNNDFGMQIFDFEFRNGEFFIQYCFPSMDRKSLLKILETDFRMLIFPDYDIVKIKQDKTDGIDEAVYYVKMKTGKWLYGTSAASKEIFYIRSKGKIISKTLIEIDRTTGSDGKIGISNPLIKLKLIMNPMGK